jgi:hypothetical protein
MALGWINGKDDAYLDHVRPLHYAHDFTAAARWRFAIRAEFRTDALTSTDFYAGLHHRSGHGRPADPVQYVRSNDA